MRVKETLNLKNYFFELMYIFDLELKFRTKFFGRGRGKNVIFWEGFLYRWVECPPRKAFFLIRKDFLIRKAFFIERLFYWGLYRRKTISSLSIIVLIGCSLLVLYYI